MYQSLYFNPRFLFKQIIKKSKNQTIFIYLINQVFLLILISNNNIGSDGAKAVASEIAKCTNLSTLTLDLESNNIGSDGAKAVASEIAKCTNLSTLTLDLDENNIGSDGAKAVASEIAKCTNLSTLTLDF
ncbi:kinase domain protein, partial (macronuclear) [Tetrahymena thermophila SB210]